MSAMLFKLPQRRPCPRKGLLDLPVEIRRQIYRGLLVAPTPVVLGYFPQRLSVLCYSYLGSPPYFEPCGPLLRVCKQVHEEALEVFYSENIFEARFGYEFAVEENFAGIAQNLQRIRRLQILVWPRGKWSLQPFDPQATTWAPRLSGVNLLRVIVEQPPRIVESRLDRLQALLSLLRKFCRVNAVFEVDDNDAKEIDAMVRATLPGCRKVSSLCGDRYFQRGDWKREYPPGVALPRVFYD